MRTKRFFRSCKIMVTVLMFAVCSFLHAANTNDTPLAGGFNIEQTLSEQAQRTTIAFDGLAFLTGDLCSDSFIPPGKIADFFGFQFLRDNDPDEMGHNTDFLTVIANNVFYILTDSQVDELIALAESQVTQNNDYAYMRFPLMDAFRRLLDGDIPEGSDGLDKDAVMEYSAELYRLDGLISYNRAEVIGGIIRSLDSTQIAYLDDLAAVGMLSWPDVGEQLNPQGFSHDVHVLVMTYASQLFSWYAGSVEADTYFCPERQGTYFGSFYLKDMPAMGNPNYTINPNLTADLGEAFLAALTPSQAVLVTDLVDIQWDDLNEIVDTREEISTQLRRFMSGTSVSSDAIVALADSYGRLDGAIIYNYATNFVAVGNTLTSAQQTELMVIRDLDDYPCSGAYLYSENIAMPSIQNTDFLFGTDSGGGGGDSEIALSRSEMDFGATGNFMTGSQSFLIENTGTGALSWSVSSDASWLNVSPSSGSGSGVVTVSVSASGLSAGSYSGTLSVSDSNASNSPQTISVSLNVYNAGATEVPFGEFSTPLEGASVSSSIPVTGWVLDDIEVASVKIYNGSSYIGDAVFVEGARPDVEVAYGQYPNNYKAGWGYMLLTNFLPGGGNGSYTLYAKATDVEGNEITLGSKTISINNDNAVKPFGAIDSPAQCGIASGSDYSNNGWALTPHPNQIPTNGSTINVLVNGVNLGHPTYNINRPDIAALFPSYANSSGAAGSFSLDTTAYENGIYTIQWTVTDNAGNADGIGSRFFIIQNTDTDQASPDASMLHGNCLNLDEQAPALLADFRFATDITKVPTSSDTVGFQKGFSNEDSYTDVSANGQGVFSLSIDELERVVIHLNSSLSVSEGSVKSSPDDSSFYYTGYLVVGNELRELPTGSAIHGSDGIFYWQPGPGFYGEYQLVFIGTSSNDGLSSVHKKSFTINIR